MQGKGQIASINHLAGDPLELLQGPLELEPSKDPWEVQIPHVEVQWKPGFEIK